jgi:hypothetical protein
MILRSMRFYIPRWCCSFPYGQIFAILKICFISKLYTRSAFYVMYNLTGSFLYEIGTARFSILYKVWAILHRYESKLNYSGNFLVHTLVSKLNPNPFDADMTSCRAFTSRIKCIIHDKRTLQPWTTHLHLVPRSRMRGGTRSLPQYAFMAWCSVKAQGQLYLTSINP